MPIQHQTVKLIRIFVSSPGYVTQEREVLDEAITSINSGVGQQHGVRLEAWKWEDQVIPHIGPPPQSVVDAQLPAYDIYLGIMASRFGTPTNSYGSGTEKEFRDALERWGEQGDLKVAIVLTSCFTEASFTSALRLWSAPSSPQADTVELTA